jgi:small GTP-binding protein
MNSSICLLGSSNSGKTSFVNKLINSDPLFNSPTIGVEYTSQYFKTNDGIITWNIWDCGGFYKCLNIFSSYISNSDIYLVFLDISRPIRYQEIDNYFKIINDIKYNPIILLVCTKADLTQIIDDKKINNICENYNIDYLKISLKDDSINFLIDKVNSYIKNLPQKNNIEYKNTKTIYYNSKHADNNRYCCCIF